MWLTAVAPYGSDKGEVGGVIVGRLQKRAEYGVTR